MISRKSLTRLNNFILWGVNNIYLHMSRRGNWRFRRNPQYKLYLYLDPGKLFFCTLRQDPDYPLF